MKYLYNPLSHEVKTTYDVKGDGVPVEFVLPSEKITEFDNEVIFNHMCNFLITAVLNERNIIHFDANREKVREEVVKILE